VTPKVLLLVEHTLVHMTAYNHERCSTVRKSSRSALIHNKTVNILMPHNKFNQLYSHSLMLHYYIHTHTYTSNCCVLLTCSTSHTSVLALFNAPTALAAAVQLVRTIHLLVHTSSLAVLRIHTLEAVCTH
jgi:hypothetical protein